MTIDTRARVHQLNRELWKLYEPAITPGMSAALAFIVRARTEDEVRGLVELFRSRGLLIAWLKKRWWPPSKRWELAARSDPLALSLEAVDRWSDELVNDLEPRGATLTHWVPVPAGA